MKLYNFHSHTNRCEHAFGEDEEYIVNAIQEGFSYFGVSDHVMIKGIEQKRIRGSYPEQFQDYLNSFYLLKDKYSKDIDLYLGMEAEYSPYLYDYYKSLLKNDLEYLILGQHFYLDENKMFHNYDKIPLGVEQYVNDVIEGIKSGLFLYVAHPDLIVYFYDKRDDYLLSLLKKIIQTSIDYDVPLELNVSKVENNRFNGDPDPKEHAPFPLDMFWSEVSKMNAKVIIGLDSHLPNRTNRYAFEYALKYAEQYNLNILDGEEIVRRIKKKH